VSLFKIPSTCDDVTAIDEDLEVHVSASFGHFGDVVCDNELRACEPHETVFHQVKEG